MKPHEWSMVPFEVYRTCGPTSLGSTRTPHYQMTTGVSKVGKIE